MSVMVNVAAVGVKSTLRIRAVKRPVVYFIRPDYNHDF